MLSEQEIRELLNQPAIQLTLKNADIGEALRNPYSLEYRACTTLITAYNAKVELQTQQQHLHQLMTILGEKNHPAGAQGPRYQHANNHSARAETLYQQNHKLLQDLIKRLADAQNQHQKLQKELDELITKQSELLQTKLQLTQDKKELVKTKENLRDEQIKFIKEKNPHLDGQALQERIKQYDAVQLSKGNLNTIKEAGEKGIFGADLLRNNKFQKDQNTVISKIQKNENAQEQIETKQAELEPQLKFRQQAISTLKSQIKEMDLQVQQLSPESAKTLRRTPFQTANFILLEPHEWRNNAAKKQLKKEEEEKEIQQQPQMRPMKISIV